MVVIDVMLVNGVDTNIEVAGMVDGVNGVR